MMNLQAYLCDFYAHEDIIHEHTDTWLDVDEFGEESDVYMDDDFYRIPGAEPDPSGICDACGGTGLNGSIEDLPCPECNGEGRLW